MLDGRMSILQDIVIAQRQKELARKADWFRMLDEAALSRAKDHPARIAAIAAWMGSKLVQAGRGLEQYARRQGECAQS